MTVHLHMESEKLNMSKKLDIVALSYMIINLMSKRQSLAYFDYNSTHNFKIKREATHVCNLSI